MGHNRAVMKSSRARAATAALLSLALAGCSLFGEWHRSAPSAPPPAPPAAPPQPPPVANERFTLSADQDVVGVVQVVSAGKEDTLTDIARRFNVGYEEILRANPQVDPWLPGEGREIVIPSQFILPDAPRTGIVINIPAMRIF
jgi:L,D-transpeptidase ErfK/SrfK